MLESVHQPDPVANIDKMNTMKLELMAEIPKLLHSLMKNQFPDAEAGSPSDMAGYYEDIEKILYSQQETPENEAKWKTLFVDVVDTQTDLQDSLGPGKPVMIGKRNAALFYDRQSKLFDDIKEYVLVTLGLPEDEK
jgi:hypothetical protein